MKVQVIAGSKDPSEALDPQKGSLVLSYECNTMQLNKACKGCLKEQADFSRAIPAVFSLTVMTATGLGTN